MMRYRPTTPKVGWVDILAQLFAGSAGLLIALFVLGLVKP